MCVRAYKFVEEQVEMKEAVRDAVLQEDGRENFKKKSEKGAKRGKRTAVKDVEVSDVAKNDSKLEKKNKKTSDFLSHPSDSSSHDPANILVDSSGIIQSFAQFVNLTHIHFQSQGSLSDSLKVFLRPDVDVVKPNDEVKKHPSMRTLTHITYRHKFSYKFRYTFRQPHTHSHHLFSRLTFSPFSSLSTPSSPSSLSSLSLLSGAEDFQRNKRQCRLTLPASPCWYGFSIHTQTHIPLLLSYIISSILFLYTFILTLAYMRTNLHTH